MTGSTMNAKSFFSRVDSFVEYRKTVYESSCETIRSNLTDLRLFERFVGANRFPTITGDELPDVPEERSP
jgi:hypothetical protein